jgi:hypothetical protein
VRATSRMLSWLITVSNRTKWRRLALGPGTGQLHLRWKELLIICSLASDNETPVLVVHLLAQHRSRLLEWRPSLSLFSWPTTDPASWSRARPCRSSLGPPPIPPLGVAPVLVAHLLAQHRTRLRLRLRPSPISTSMPASSISTFVRQRRRRSRSRFSVWVVLGA